MGDYQNAFVPGRLLVDNCQIAHEIIQFVKKRKKGRVYAGVMKIDLNKAYDRIRWDFVEKVLRAYRFPEIWVNWIMQCVTRVSYSILVNGEPSSPFKPKCGLRQGDPLSPYIFILCMEALSHKMIHLQAIRAIQGIKIGRHAPRINHLFFCRRCSIFLQRHTGVL